MLTRHPAISGDRPGEEPIAPPAPVSAPSDLPSPAAGAETDDVQASLRRRILSPHTLISFAVAVALLWFVMRRMDIDPRAIWAQVRQASPLLLAVAFLFWYGSFFVRAWRWGRMLDRSGVADAPTSQLPSTAGLTEIMLLGWFANSIVPAKLGDAYRGYLLKRESRVSFSGGFGTILAERFVDAMMLVVVLGGTALLVFGGRMPEEATLALTLGAILLVAGIGGIILMWFTRDTLLRLLPDRLRDVYARLQGAVFGSLRSPALVLGIGLLLWLGDGMRVWFVARSLNAGISPSVAILVALMGALLTVIPFTPAGLGVVELGVGSILIGVFGLDPVLAGSIIVLDRVVAYWSLLVVGALLYLRRARRDLRAAAVEQPAT